MGWEGGASCGAAGKHGLGREGWRQGQEQKPTTRNKLVNRGPGVKIHKIPPEKGGQQNPHVYTGHHRKHGDFLSPNALSWGGGKLGFVDPETLYGKCVEFAPCKGWTGS